MTVASDRKARALLHWYAASLHWVGERSTDRAYCRLLFAFALSRLGELGPVPELLQRADQALREADESSHHFLNQAFRYRVRQSLEGEPHRGPLPAKMRHDLERLEHMARYAVDRLRQCSRVLEPDEPVDPYRKWYGKTNALDAELAQLHGDYDAERINLTLRGIELRWANVQGQRSLRLRFHGAALDFLPRLREEDALHFLGAAGHYLLNLAYPKTERGFVLCTDLSRKIAQASADFGEPHLFDSILAYIGGLLPLPRSGEALEPLAGALTVVFRGLARLGKVQTLDRASCEVTDWLAKQGTTVTPARMHLLLAITEARLLLGKQDQALALLDEVRDRLLYRRGGLREEEGRERNRLACRYIEVLGHGPLDLAHERIEELLENLPQAVDSYSTSHHFTLPALQVAEMVALTALALEPPIYHVADEEARKLARSVI